MADEEEPLVRISDPLREALGNNAQALALVPTLDAHENALGTFPADAAEVVLNAIEAAWSMAAGEGTDHINLWERGAAVLGLVADEARPMEVQVLAMGELHRMCELVRFMNCQVHPNDGDPRESMLSAATENGREQRRRLSLLGDRAIALADAMRAYSRFHVLQMGGMQLAWFERNPSMLFDLDLRDHQVVLNHVMQILSVGKYRRHGDAVYMQIAVKDKEGQARGTHAWARKNSVLNFVYECVDKHRHWELYKLMLNSGNMRTPIDISEHLMRAKEDEFPVLEFDRHTFSFRDGIFDAYQLAFYPFAAREQWTTVAHAAQCAIEALSGQPGSKPLVDFAPPTPSVATMKFFDMPFGSTQSTSSRALTTTRRSRSTLWTARSATSSAPRLCASSRRRSWRAKPSTGCLPCLVGCSSTWASSTTGRWCSSSRASPAAASRPSPCS